MNYQSIIHPYPTKTQQKKQQQQNHTSHLNSVLLSLSEQYSGCSWTFSLIWRTWTIRSTFVPLALCLCLIYIICVIFVFHWFRCQESRKTRFSEKLWFCPNQPDKSGLRDIKSFFPSLWYKNTFIFRMWFENTCVIKTLLYLKCDLKILASLWLRPWTATNHLNTLSLNNVFTLFY